MAGPWNPVGGYLEGKAETLELLDRINRQRFINDYANALMVPQSQPPIEEEVSIPQPPIPTAAQVDLSSPGGAISPFAGSTPSGGVDYLSGNAFGPINVPNAPLAPPIPAPDLIETRMIPQPDIIPLVEQGKAYGLPEEVIKKNPVMAFKYIQEKEAERKKIKETMYSKLLESAITNGDNDLAKKILMRATRDPDMMELANELGDVNILGKNEFEITSRMSADQLRETARKAMSPEMAEMIMAANPGTYKIKQKGGRIVGFEPAQDLEEKNKTEEQLTWAALYGNTPEERERARAVLDDMEKRRQQKFEFNITTKEESTKRLRQLTLDNPDAFKNWTPAEQDQLIIEHIITGKDPRFAFGDRESYTAFQHAKARYSVENGFTPGLIARLKSDYKAGDASLRNQKKIYDMMNGFVVNINKQVGRLEDIYKEVPRATPSMVARLVNMPIVALRRTAAGSGDEASVASYLIEISNEIGKLSTGSSASIRELSESAQERWNNIHDPKLTFEDMMKILRITKVQANDRLRSAEIAMDVTRSAIERLGNPPEPTPQTSEGQVMNTLPDPAQFKGKTIKVRDATGKLVGRRTSDGTKWGPLVPVKE